MKKLLLLLVLCTGSLMYSTSYAQLSLRVNISSQPIWGPTGYDHVDYYYLPDIEAYYSVDRHRYYYMEHGSWIGRTNLPERYRNYDVYNSRKIVINESRPYLRHKEFKERYAISNERYNPQPIRDSHEPRYFENKKHPEHSKWKEYRKGQRNQGEKKNEKRRN